MTKPKAGAVQDRPQRPSTPIRVEIDWVGYYRDFEDKHRGTTGPILADKVWLLFPDGWRHHAFDYRGPEVPPPDDPRELRKLLTFYWETLEEISRREKGKLDDQVENLERIRDGLSGDLKCKVVNFDEGKQMFVSETRDLTVDVWEGRLIWLRLTLDECERRLAELREEL